MNTTRLIRSMPALPVLAAIAVALAGVGATQAGASPHPRAATESTVSDLVAGTPDAPTTVPGSEEDFVATAGDFVNLNDMTAVRGFFLTNTLGHLDEALAVANSPTGGVYPVGTIIQLVPFEAMVKRAPGFSPEAGDWEFFELAASADGTEIIQRGGAEIVNQFGGSCSGCHMEADPQWDFICENDHGCTPLPIGDDVIASVQAADPRPRLAPDSTAPGVSTSPGSG